MRSSDEKLFPTAGKATALEDSTSGPDAPDLELLFAPMAYSGDPSFSLPPGDYCTLTPVLLRYGIHPFPTVVVLLTFNLSPDLLALAHLHSKRVTSPTILPLIPSTPPLPSLLPLFSVLITSLHSYLATEHDLEVLLRGMKLLLRIAQTEPFASCIDTSDSAVHPNLDTKIFDLNDLQLKDIIRQRAMTMYVPLPPYLQYAY